ncbi:AAA family ATPase, partial [Streptomyces sp. NPDC057654]|uniref:AAA family ATPase n=1 Tax=Streptomyces sp. NPDC057654 TaxID=3346196 RepID=UPI0036C5D441
LIVVTGPGGIGKTALANRFLHGLRERYPDGQLYADLRGHPLTEPVRPVALLARFLRAYGHSTLPDAEEELAALWRTVSSGRSTALLLDNAASGDQVLPLIPGTGTHLVTVTSRRPLTSLTGTGAFHPLGPLPPDAAAELMAHWITPDRLAAEPAATADLVTSSRGLPLLLRVTAAQLAARPAQTLTAAAAEIRPLPRPRPENPPTDQGAAVTAHLDTAYHTLRPVTQTVYRLLGASPLIRIDTEATAALCQLPAHEALQELTALTEANLLESRNTAGRRVFAFHDDIRAHARQQAHDTLSAAQRRQALRRLLDWYVYVATAAEKLVTPSHHGRLPRTYISLPDLPVPFETKGDALCWYTTQQDNLLALVPCADREGLDTSCWQAVSAMWGLFLHHKLHQESIQAHTLAIRAAQRSAQVPAGQREEGITPEKCRQAEREMRTSGAVALRGTGHYAIAWEWYDLALVSALQDNDPHHEAQALNGMGECHLDQGQPGLAKGYFAEARSLREDNEDPRGAALSQLEQGKAELADHNPHSAVDLLSAAHHKLASRDAYNANRALAYLGYARGLAGDYDTGCTDLREALGVFTRLETHSVHWIARSHELLGELAEHHGHLKAAWAAYTPAQAFYAQVSPQDAERVQDRLDRLSLLSPPPGSTAP